MEAAAAPTPTVPGNRVAWQASAADLRAAHDGAVIAPLGELGVIAVEGADAGAFLQSQLTNDSSAAREGVIRNGYCTAKGRLLAVFDHWSEDDVHFLLLPREILAPVMKRLSMFVLRAKARLADASDRWSAFGLLGPGAAAAAAALRKKGLIVAAQPDGMRCRERFLLLAPAALRDDLLRGLAGMRCVDQAVWWWSQIDAGVPTVLAATQEKFVPQMVNLEVLGGVNFKKGCYPGQEVVARSQYLGKLRRRMHLAHTDGKAHAGADVGQADDAQPIGTVVLAAGAPGGGMDMLFECPVESVGKPLQVDGAPLAVRALPYAIVDVTA
jgi:folate-binding protein YgfZ